MPARDHPPARTKARIVRVGTVRDLGRCPCCGSPATIVVVDGWHFDLLGCVPRDQTDAAGTVTVAGFTLDELRAIAAEHHVR